MVETRGVVGAEGKSAWLKKVCARSLIWSNCWRDKRPASTAVLIEKWKFRTLYHEYVAARSMHEQFEVR